MVKRLLVIAALSALPVLWCAPSDASVEEKVTQLEKEWAQSMVSGDSSVTDRIESPDIVSTAPDGTVSGKSQDMEDLRSHKLTAGSADLEDLKVRVYGRTAVVTGRTVLKAAKYGDMDISGEYRFTDTWVQTAGKWQVVASQATAIQKH